MTEIQSVRLAMTPSTVLRRALAVLVGAVAVALSAQVAIPLSSTPVPVTLQVPVVLLVGALLGPRLGAASLVTYLAMGVAGLPVFAAAPGLPLGMARLIGPTGGYLLAYPVAAAAVGMLADHRSWTRIAAALVAGTAVIHLGGVVQFWALTGSIAFAFAQASLPFLLLDLVKLIVAGLIVRHVAGRSRALL